jgi:adenine phosphoribosyltransferase
MELLDLHSDVWNAVKPVPFKGISEFFDISGLLKNPKLFQRVINALTDLVSKSKPSKICALDARGFLFGAPIALRLGLPLVMIRKKGKLPGECLMTVFDKEYESGDVLEIQCGAIEPGEVVVVIDDVLATGGSMNGAFELVRRFSPQSVTGVCLMDLYLPNSRDFLTKHNIEVESLLDVRKWN